MKRKTSTLAGVRFPTGPPILKALSCQKLFRPGINMSPGWSDHRTTVLWSDLYMQINTYITVTDGHKERTQRKKYLHGKHLLNLQKGLNSISESLCFSKHNNSQNRECGDHRWQRNSLYGLLLTAFAKLDTFIVNKLLSSFINWVWNQCKQCVQTAAKCWQVRRSSRRAATVMETTSCVAFNAEFIRRRVRFLTCSRRFTLQL